LVADPDYEWLMIEANPIKVHLHVSASKGGNQEIRRSKGHLI
jgi:hypothetical protein